jgi:hypothetical protein
MPKRRLPACKEHYERGNNINDTRSQALRPQLIYAGAPKVKISLALSDIRCGCSRPLCLTDSFPSPVV